jgi:hypothetical protein
MPRSDFAALQPDPFVVKRKHKLEGTTCQLKESVNYYASRCGILQGRLAEADATVEMLRKKQAQILLASNFKGRPVATDKCSGIDEGPKVAALKARLKNAFNKVDQLEASASRKDEELTLLQSLLVIRDRQVVKIIEVMRPVLGLLEHYGTILEERQAIKDTTVKLKDKLSRLRDALTRKRHDLITAKQTLNDKQEELDHLNGIFEDQSNHAIELERLNARLAAKYAELVKDNELLVVKHHCLDEEISLQLISQNTWEDESAEILQARLAIRLEKLRMKPHQSIAKVGVAGDGLGTPPCGSTQVVEDVMGVEAEQETQTCENHDIADASQTETQLLEIQSDAAAHGCTDDYQEARDVDLEDISLGEQDMFQLDSVDRPAYDWALVTLEGATDQKETHGEDSLQVTQQAVENQSVAECTEAADDYHMVGNDGTRRDDAHLQRAHLPFDPLDPPKMYLDFPSSVNNLANHDDASSYGGTMTPDNVSIADDEWEVLNNCSEL